MDEQPRNPGRPDGLGIPEEATGAPASSDEALESQGSAAEGTMRGSPDPLQAEAERTDTSTQFGSSKSDMYRDVPGDRIGG